ncbi:HrpB1 family type III secretion system apparatus protein [Ideonella sp. DXS29W]|uniref:HrpB1 family type III secretion system apparatus protein n=1 Tax=Ideonella lacteola TaxID=2984193 RepID=A0ABU9BHD1_9BURK
MNLLLKVKQREFVQCLVELVSTAVHHNLVDEAEATMACLRQVRPKLDQLDFFDGWIAILKSDWTGAMRIAHACAERTGDWPFGTALLAYCQYATGDKGWAASAERVLAQEDCPDARRMMMLLLGRVDPSELGCDQGLLDALSGGQDTVIGSNFVLA